MQEQLAVGITLIRQVLPALWIHSLIGLNSLPLLLSPDLGLTCDKEGLQGHLEKVFLMVKRPN